jgi:hypothetical protein
MEYYLAVRMRRFDRGHVGMQTEERPMELRRLLDDRRERPMMSAFAGHVVRPMARSLPPRARAGRDG